MVWFGELSSARSSSGFGANPISFAEILAWAQLTHRAPTPFEVSVLHAIDASLLAMMNKPDE